MGDLRRALLTAQDVLTGVGGDLEMMIEEEPGKNTPLRTSCAVKSARRKSPISNSV